MKLLDGINDTEDELYTFDSIMETKTTSKGLEALENIALNHTRFGNGKDFEIVEKELKALEIIKNKKVDVRFLNIYKDAKNYNKFHEYTITQEEYNLLKEVLNNGR